MRKSIVLVAALAALVLLAGTALAAGHRHHAAPVVVKALGGMKMVPNKYFQDEMRFSPGTIHVTSGQSITFEFGDKESEPHTLTIVPRSALPANAMQAEQCRACRYATGHLKNPKAAPDATNPIVHWVLNKGPAGLDEVGDSIAIQPGGKHKSVTVAVTAKPGTTLYFLCAVHPWMQGKIVVG